MEAQPLYDLAPLARLMLLGALIALGPLAWVRFRNRGASPMRRLQALTVLTLFLTFDLVLFGAFTRLTDSGLGCPDWPGCYGSVSPVGAKEEILSAQTAMPTGPVTHSKAWVEMIHRYLATGVGVLIIAMTASAWVQHRAASRSAPRPSAAAQGGVGPGALQVPNPWWPTFSLVWVCLQGAFGALTVTMKLFPAIVTLHLVGGIVLLALLCVQAVQHTRASEGIAQADLSKPLRAALWGTAALVSAQVVLGGWVSTNYAVLACTTFPTCQGSWWPVMDFAHGFQVWRELGMLQDGSHISFAGLTAIHYVHRLMAYGVLAALVGLAWRLHAVSALRSQALWLAGLAALQLATGLSNVVLGWPLVAAVLHTGGAAALIVVLTWAIAASRSGTSPSEISAPLRAPRVIA